MKEKIQTVTGAQTGNQKNRYSITSVAAIAAISGADILALLWSKVWPWGNKWPHIWRSGKWWR